jgi:hypothetical protein
MTNSSGDPVHTPRTADQGGGSGPWVIAGLVAVVAIIAVAFMVISRDREVTSEDMRTVAEQSRLQGLVEGAQAGADSAQLSAQMAGDRVAAEARSAAYAPVAEQRIEQLGVGIRDASSSSSRAVPADIWLPSSRHALDITIGKPRPNDTHPPAHDGFQNKMRKYRDVLDSSVTFLPLAFEYGGRIHPDSRVFLVNLATRSAPRKGLNISSNVKWFLRRIHLTIDQGNALMVLARLRILNRHTTNSSINPT